MSNQSFLYLWVEILGEQRDPTLANGRDSKRKHREPTLRSQMCGQIKEVYAQKIA